MLFSRRTACALCSLLALACSPIDPFHGLDAGPGIEAGASPLQDARRVPVEQGGSYCDQTGECEACTACALRDEGLCLPVARACRDARCDGIAPCLEGCVSDQCAQECVDGVVPRELFEERSLRECVACGACIRDCAAVEPRCGPG